MEWIRIRPGRRHTSLISTTQTTTSNMIPVLTTCGWISSFRRCISLIYNKMGLTIFSVGVEMGWMNVHDNSRSSSSSSSRLMKPSDCPLLFVRSFVCSFFLSIFVKCWPSTCMLQMCHWPFSRMPSACPCPCVLFIQSAPALTHSLTHPSPRSQAQLKRSPFRLRNGSAASYLLFSLARCSASTGAWLTGAASSLISLLGLPA